jgi:hypothetical protein
VETRGLGKIYYPNIRKHDEGLVIRGLSSKDNLIEVVLVLPDDLLSRLNTMACGIYSLTEIFIATKDKAVGEIEAVTEWARRWPE